MTAAPPARQKRLLPAATANAVGVAALSCAGAAAKDGSDAALPWVDRNALKRLSGARTAPAGALCRGCPLPGAILEGPEDYFIPVPGKELVYRGLKAEAQRLIGQMPARGRESYELQYGARARQMLGDAVANGNSGDLAEVSRQFFHTEAGYQATLLLGLSELDHGRPLAGALALRRLREAGEQADAFEPLLSLAMATCWVQAGMPDEARRVLIDLKRRERWPRVEIAGHEVRLFAEGSDPVEWLRGQLGSRPVSVAAETEAWAMFRGSPGRNAATKASDPLLSLRWRIPLTDDPAIEAFLQQQVQTNRDHGITSLPVLSPLAVNDVILMRTVRNLLAIDFLTGKRVWEVPVDDRLDALLGAGVPESMLQQVSQVSMGLQQRVWCDSTYGTLSSDGRCVFSIEDLGLGPGQGMGMGMQVGRQVFNVRGQRIAAYEQPHSYNRLAAHDVRTGKLKWHLGGPADQFALRQPEVFFLGPPLPVAGRLYVLAEVKEEIRLMALDARTGDLVWSQQLAVAEQSLQGDPWRRMSGLTPSYADGILVCPTATGAVVGVDISTRWLLWRYPYDRTRESMYPANMFFIAPMGMVAGGLGLERWNDGSVTIAEGRVVVGPVESNEIHCLNLLDGKLLWKESRRDEANHREDVYLACVYGGKVVLVGKRYVRAVSLADGTAAWNGAALALPNDANPSGRGFLSGSTYFVPLSSAAVAAIDLDAGQLLRVSSSREGTVPGNLVCYKGRVLSQSPEGVECYYQIDALRGGGQAPGREGR